jgi:hypothetical protein
MKTSTKILLFTFIISLLLILASILLVKNYVTRNSEKASGIIKTRTIDVPYFENIMISGEFDITLKQSETQSVNVIVDDAFQKHIKVGVTNKTLNISSVNFIQTFGARVEINYTTINNIQLLGSAKLSHPDTMHAEYLKVQTSAGSSVKLIGNFIHLVCTASAGSKMVLAGNAENAEFTVDSGSQIHALEMEAQQCIIQASSGSSAEIHVSKTLDATANSGSSVIYTGSPEMKSHNTSSGASIRKLDTAE